MAKGSDEFFKDAARILDEEDNKPILDEGNSSVDAVLGPMDDWTAHGRRSLLKSRLLLIAKLTALCLIGMGIGNVIGYLFF